MKLRRIVGLSGFLVAALIAVDWFPPLNDAVYPPPEDRGSTVSGIPTAPVEIDGSGGPGPSPTALVVPTAEPAIPASSPGDASVSGIASWYRYRSGEAAAGPALRVGDWRGSVVTVCGRACATVTLTDWCQCYGTRLIDLDAGMFEEVCGALKLGLCTVTLEW